MNWSGTPLRVTCHCGAVELSVVLEHGLADAARCDCSFCSRRQAAAVTALRGNVEIVKGADRLTTYSFGTHTARHHFCSVCGIYTHHNRRSDTDEVGINAACIEGVDIRALGEIPWNDGVNHPSDRSQDG
ncbi:GFA family protein [Oceaniglobus roseus]|uniref:GFA family protein n=1 Tax=Oceaniglobus roseus TaxID=1737570 RepID=UPI000C7F1A2E|nr:GFA family protein [Kandeliimicrobium roseum]